MRHLPDIEFLDLDEGPIEVRLLGSGMYSAAFQDVWHSSRVFLLCEQDAGQDCRRDRSKEVLALARTYHNNKHLPTLKLHGVQRIQGCQYEVWETRLTVSADCEGMDHVTPEAQVLADVYPIDAQAIKQRRSTGELKVSPGIVQALIDIERACEAFGLHKGYNGSKYYNYDLHNGNFGLDRETNTLILRDPITAFF